MTQLKAILFDNDGTLVDTHEVLLTCFRHATRTVLNEVIPDDVLMAKVGQPLVVQMWDYTDDPDVHQRLCDAYHTKGKEIHDEKAALYEGVAETLAQLKEQGYIFGVVTSKLHDACVHGLELFGIADFFDCVVSPDDCEGAKPSPEPVIYAAGLLGLKPEECVYVGDSPFDMQAGNGAGCITVAAQWGMFSDEVLAENNPTYTCRHFSDLLDVEAIVAKEV